jgi:phosphopantothenoylcysteine decarboxylase/phosphopantothenate--cysteine ligase
MARVVRDLTEKEEFDIGVFAAAPADYKPISPRVLKINTREYGKIVLELETTPKVIKNILKKPRYIVAFAAETLSGDELLNKAREKLIEYRADLVVGNSVLSAKAGFAKEYLEAIIITKDDVVASGLLLKYEIARLILDKAHEGLSLNK